MSNHEDDNLEEMVQARVREEKDRLAQDQRPVIDRAFVEECLRQAEYGDGRLFAALHRDRLLYCTNSAEWYVWAGTHWKRDDLNHALAAVEAVNAEYLRIYNEITTELNTLVAQGNDDGAGERRKKLWKIMGLLIARQEKIRTTRRRSSCLQMAYSLADIDDRLAIAGEEFDRHPMLFPCANGVVDLETGELLAGRPRDYMTRSSPVSFLGIQEPAPLWDQTLLQIFNGDQDLVDYLQRLFGYSMTGLVMEKVFPVLYGKTGWNGRSLIIEAISRVMGDMASPINSEMLLASKTFKGSSGPSPDVMALRGLRLAFASEIDDGQRFNAGKIKKLTGKDQLVGRNPHDKYQTVFEPTHKLLVMTNTQPSAPANDRAFWERLHLVDFHISFVNREPQEDHERRAILNLDQKLKAEDSGILAWLVRGCLNYQRDGINPPRSVLEASERYRRNEDMIADFVDECLEKEIGATEQASKIYQAFVSWYHQNHGGKEPSGSWFGKRLSDKFEKGKSHGCNIYYGIYLKS